MKKRRDEKKKKKTDNSSISANVNLSLTGAVSSVSTSNTHHPITSQPKSPPVYSTNWIRYNTTLRIHLIHTSRLPHRNPPQPLRLDDIRINFNHGPRRNGQPPIESPVDAGDQEDRGDGRPAEGGEHHPSVEGEDGFAGLVADADVDFVGGLAFGVCHWRASIRISWMQAKEENEPEI